MWALKLSSELFPLLHQNPLVSHELWMDLLPLHGFVNYIEHLETFELWDVPTIDTFHYVKNKTKPEKLHLLISTVTSSEDSWSNGKLPSSWWSIEVFQKFFFPLKAQILPLVTNTVSCLPESNRLLSFTFKHAWIALFVCQFCSAAGNSICAQVLSLKQPSYFAVGQTYFEYISHFITNNIKNLCI